MASHHRKQRIKINYVKRDNHTPRHTPRHTPPSPSTNDANIYKWLRKHKLTEYESIFVENNISINQLTKLNATALADMAMRQLKIKPMLHRKRFLNAVLSTKHSISNKRKPKTTPVHRPHRAMSTTTSNYNTDDSKQSPTNNGLLHEMKPHSGGYKLYLFENQTEALKYECSLCHQVSFNAVELACDEDVHIPAENNEDHDGIFYCKSCLKSYLRNNNDTCPINPSHHNTKYRDNRYIRKRVNNLIMSCPRSYKSRLKDDHETDTNRKEIYCEWKGPLSDLVRHLQRECECKKHEQIKNGKTSVKYGKNRAKKTKMKPNHRNHINHINDRFDSQIQMNVRQIEILTQKMQMQYEQMCILKEENRNMKSKLNRNTQDMLQFKVQNKQLLDNMDRLRKRLLRQTSVDDEIRYLHPSNKYELYHPKILIHRKVHKSTVSLIHSQDIEPQVIERKYHSKIRNDDGYWTCCNGDRDSKGCSIESTKIMIYPCCGKREDSEGCMNGYMCCGGNMNATGCKDSSYYPCCNKKRTSNGCKKRYICCKQSYPKAKGCQINVQ
eukprot:111101_1